MKEIAKRFKEPSSWAGIAVILGFIAPQFNISIEVIDSVIQVGSAVAGVLAIALPENKEA